MYVFVGETSYPTPSGTSEKQPPFIGGPKGENHAICGGRVLMPVWLEQKAFGVFPHAQRWRWLE